MHTENINFVPHNDLNLTGANWHQTNSFTATDIISSFSEYSQESGSFSTPTLSEPINAEDMETKFQRDFSKSVFTDNFNLADFSDSSYEWKHGEPLTGDKAIDLDSTHFVKEDIFIDSEFILEAAVSQTREQLELFANDEEFLTKINQAFDDNFSSEKATALIQELASGDLIPEMKIVSAAELNNANGAFGEETIYLSEEFLTKNQANSEAIESVLLEEIGHYIDLELNSVDSPGDEGDIFAQLVLDKTISEAELVNLQNEDDKTTVDINGEIIDVELAAPPFPGEDFIYDGQSSVPYNSDVEAWQQRMADRGWDIAVDGKYGPASESIALQFQEAKDLDVDGIVDPQTWEATFSTGTPLFPGEDFIYDGQSSVPYNSDVEAWQQRMADRGWDIAVDGKYGPASESIALQLQEAKDLDVDGIVGPQTWEATFNTGTPPFPGEDFIYDGQSSVPYNSDVEAWQQRMADRGWNIAIDGKYGPASESIALQFQEQQGLKVDGIVGPQTWEATFDNNDVSLEDTPTPPEETPPPPSESSFRDKVVEIAYQEWEEFGQGTLFEEDPNAVSQIEEYFESFGGEYTGQAWSAAFVSWVMEEAGAEEEFYYSQLHADYINQAIADRESDVAFVGRRIDEYSLQPGDLIGANREGEDNGEITVTYDDATNYNSYNSHVDIVVATRPGEIDVIGGNVSNSVSLRTYEVDSEGKLINPDDGSVIDDFFVVIENRFGEDTSSPPTEPSSPPEGIEFGDYNPVAEAPEFVTEEFLAKTFDISQNLGVAPEYLIAVMGHETGGSFDPAEQNPISGAIGLIQIMPDNTIALETTPEELAAMTAVEQLDYVEQWFSDPDFSGDFSSLEAKPLEDTYLAVLYPFGAVKEGEQPDDELFVRGTTEYEQNSQFDNNEDGVILIGETTDDVREFLPGPELFATYRDSATA